MLRFEKQYAPYKMYRLRKIVLFLLLAFTETLLGQIKFRNVLGNTGYDIGASAQQTYDLGYILCGSTTSVGNGNTDIYVIKTDSLGIPKNETSIGGISVDRGTCIKQTLDSGYVVLGYTNDISGIGGYDIVVIKLNAALQVQWKKLYGGSDWEFGNCIQQTSDGGYIICGGTYSYGKGDEDYFLIKTDAIGDTLWTRTYGGADQDEARGVVETKDGGYILTGLSMSTDTLGDFYTVRTNSLGDTLWTNTYGGVKTDMAYGVIEAQAGGYLVAGETQSVGSGKSDALILEITETGKSNRTFIGGGKEDDSAVGITQRKDGTIAFIGVTFSFGFAKGDFLVVLLNSDLSYNTSTTFGSNGKETVGSIACTADDGFILCGTTNGFRNLLDDIFLIKTGNDGQANVTEKVLVTDVAETADNRSNLIIYPNPADNRVLMHFSGPIQNATISITDIAGKTLKQETVQSIQNELALQLGDLSNGIYLITIRTDKSLFSRPLIVKHAE